MSMLTARYRALAFEPVLAMSTVVWGGGSNSFFHVRPEELRAMVRLTCSKKQRIVAHLFAWAIEALDRVLARMNAVSVVAINFPNLLCLCGVSIDIASGPQSTYHSVMATAILRSFAVMRVSLFARNKREGN